MQNTKQPNPFKPEVIIEVVLRRRWWIIIPVIISLAGGVFAALTLPKTYTSTTTILVQAQKVPEDFVRSLVTEDVPDRVGTISQEILSRTNLERIIEDFDILNTEEGGGATMEGMVASMRSRIKVDISRNRRSPNAFTVSYEGNDPEQVRDIANALAGSFIDANLKMRETQVLGTSDFLEAELVTMRQRLEEKEQALRDYRFRYMGQLPQQLDANLRLLDRLQEQLSNREISLRDARARLAIAMTEASSFRTGASGPRKVTLSDLKGELVNLQTRYTEQHPDVVRLKRQIQDMEARGVDSDDGGTTPGTSSEVLNIQREIQNIEAEISRIRSQIASYESRIETTPQHEQELLAIQRDYENIQASYSSLLKRKLEAEIAVNMERKQKGEQFRVLDSAQLPTLPTSPDLRKILLVALAAGLAMGGGLVFLVEFLLHPSIKQPDDVENIFGLPVLATIPIITDQRALLWERTNFALTSIAIAFATAMLGILTLFVFFGVDAPAAWLSGIV